MIVRAMKKSKQCFIDENLARLHEDQQYNREMVQILKDSSPMKKSLSESE
jgi:tRNA1(Val) A37 N6-methylase TrmN6